MSEQTDWDVLKDMHDNGAVYEAHHQLFRMREGQLELKSKHAPDEFKAVGGMSTVPRYLTKSMGKVSIPRPTEPGWGFRSRDFSRFLAAYQAMYELATVMKVWGDPVRDPERVTQALAKIEMES